MVRLFDVSNGKVIPTEHCFTLNFLSDIMKEYPDDYMGIYTYLFYMTCPNPDLNPYFNLPEDDKEQIILQDIDANFSTEDDMIRHAVTRCNLLYETPTSRAYKGISSMLDRLALYMEKTPITHGRDGNITALVSAAKNFEGIRQSFKGAYKDLKEEQETRTRGGGSLAYDQ